MTFVLVHGMSHGAWAWDRVRARLTGDGHQVLAVDLPGHGRRAHERARASVASYARAAADAMMLAGVHDATLVGHSMAGAVIPKVAELVPARIARLVFLAAVVMRDGESLSDNFPPAIRQLMRGLARAGGGAVQYPAWLEASRWMSDLPPGDPRVVEALGLITPQPFAPWSERVDYRRFYAMAVPRAYIRCLRDAAIPPAWATAFAGRLGVTPIDLDCAHNAMMSQPDALAAILEKL
jgi:pimeloyl-ACP methyl ester carboxylesterase